MASTLLCLLVPVALPLSAQAGEPLVLTQDRPHVNAWEAITLKADATYKLSVDDMLGRLDEFEAPAQRGGTLGVRKAAMWLHIPIIAPDAPRTSWVVDIGYNSLHSDIYLTSGGKVIQHISTRPEGRPETFSRTPTMEFALTAGQMYDLLLRVEATGPLILPITLSETPHHMREVLREQMLQGLLNGLALCLLVYSLAQWATQRERLFGFYALVVLGSAGFSLQFFGIGAQYLWTGNAWMGRNAGLVAGLLALAGSFLFLGAALADTRSRLYALTMRVGGAITLAVCAGVALGVVSPAIAVAYMSLVGPVPSIISLPAAIARVRQKDPIGVTLMMAWTAYGVAAMVMVCLVQGWLPANFWTLHSFQLGATLDMLLFLRVMGLRAKAMRMEAQEVLRERDIMHSLAHSDPLTGLSNRRGLQHALRAALAHCSPRNLVAVYLLDLDGFKPINDSYGHDVGDDLLVAVGHRLQANVRHQTDMVARLGGDEFIIMACHLEKPEDAEELGRSLLRAFDQPFTLSHLRLTVGLTIGYALAPLDNDDPQGLIRLADAAMYAGKQGGKHSLRRNSGELALSS
ncbi:MAG: diguanylate cyclase domain-containing protein [Acidovorax sp.]|uniref:diguanylate cyclase domain-containing protein n=1 Tax=Acidovorax sp. TaxID=1872122 RepID=UPI00391C4BDF